MACCLYFNCLNKWINYGQKCHYKIGKAAELAGVNKETIRYYERRNLIPEPERMDSGYRLFSRRHVDQIRFIKRAQELGFTLSEIDDLLNLKMDEDTTCSEIKREAEQKYQDVIKKIEDLRRIKTTLTTLIDSRSEEHTFELQ